MRVFDDRNEGQIYTLKTRKGKEYQIEVQPINIFMYEKINRISEEMKKEFKINHVYEILTTLFPKNKRFFRKFSIQLLTKLMYAILEDVKKKD